MIMEELIGKKTLSHEERLTILRENLMKQGIKTYDERVLDGTACASWEEHSKFVQWFTESLKTPEWAGRPLAAVVQETGEVQE